MAIPSFTLDGILPPFVGDAPSETSSKMSPYLVTPNDVVNHFALNNKRKMILLGWLQYRKALREIGILEGFQWLDGSFLKDKETLRGDVPGDLDLMIFVRRPNIAKEDAEWSRFVQDNSILFNPVNIKTSYHLDAYFIDLDSNTETIIDSTRYFLQLFSHQRFTGLWKGLLEVRHEDSTREDDRLLSVLTSDLLGIEP